VVGEALLLGYHLWLLPSFGFLPAVPVILASLVVYLVVQFAAEGLRLPSLRPGSLALIAGFAALFVLALDFWQWHQVEPLLLGWPRWAWYFVLLSAVQTVLMAIWLRYDPES